MRHRGSSQRAGRWTAAASVLLLVCSAAVLVSVLPGRAGPEDGDSGRVRPQAMEPGRTRPGNVGGRPRFVYDAPPEPGKETSGGAHVQARRDRVAEWRAVLAELDRRRADAYAEADPARLRGVYLAGSRMLRRDQALLVRYRRRGLRVLQMRMRVLDLHVRAERADRVVLVVRERLARATLLRARSADPTVPAGARRRDLPTDDVDEHVLTLRRVAGRGWRIASARTAGS